MTLRVLDRPAIERLEAGGGAILIALSGGGDSTALLHLLVEALGASKLRAAVIDHGLRAGSARDARRAADFAEALGVAAEVIALTWREGESRAQQAARLARYDALCAAARRLGGQVIAAAHTADDQAETVFMRAASGSSWRGLAAMNACAPAPVWPQGRGLVLVRPLLSARRADLRDMLRARGAAWIDDPANANEAFARVRARKRLAELEAAGFDSMRLALLAAKLRPLAHAIDAEAAGLIARAVRIEGEAMHLSLAAWRGGGEARRRALSVLIAAAAGAGREPGAGLARLEARLAEDGFRGASLGGARLARAGGAIMIGRDRGALSGRADGAKQLAPLALAPGVETVWDGRLALTAAALGWSVSAGARGVELARAGEVLALEQAREQGIVQAHWLVETHVAHRLGAFLP